MKFLGSLIGPRCLCQISCDFWQSHRSPMPLPNFFSRRRRGPWCGASIGTTGSAPRALACCPLAEHMNQILTPVTCKSTKESEGLATRMRQLTESEHEKRPEIAHIGHFKFAPFGPLCRAMWVFVAYFPNARAGCDAKNFSKSWNSLSPDVTSRCLTSGYIYKVTGFQGYMFDALL